MRRNKMKQLLFVRYLSQGRDFFGISHITRKEIAGIRSATKLPPEKLVEKYDPLLQPREQKANKERDTDLIYGRIRFDNQNKPQFHGQFESGNEAKKFDTIYVKQFYVPNNRLEEQDTILEGEAVAQEQSSKNINDALKILKTEKIDISNQPPLLFSFEQNTKIEIARGAPFAKLAGHRLEEDELEEVIEEASDYTDKLKPTLIYDPEPEVSDEDSIDDFDKSIDDKYDVNHAHEPPKSALQHLKLVRAKRVEPTDKRLKQRIEAENAYAFKPSIKLDSKGFRNYQHQVPTWNGCRHVDVLNFLRKSILYHNHDVLAINKPYGLAVHAGESSQDRFNVNNLLQEIIKTDVYLAHRLDITTTGVVLFATSKKKADMLHRLFESQQIIKTYWCVTRGVPQPPHAILDIPIGEYSVAGKQRSCLVPENLDAKKQIAQKYRHAKRAVSEYRVLIQGNQTALVEVKPTTGVKHQIRCHLAFGLNTPILGDHKYSHIERIAPQTLPTPMLKALQVRQTKVRTIPMHLHAKNIVIPGAKANGETLFINAPLPPHFIQNTKSLKLVDDNIRSAFSK